MDTALEARLSRMEQEIAELRPENQSLRAVPEAKQDAREGELLPRRALLTGAALALAEVADGIDEGLLLVGECQWHRVFSLVIAGSSRARRRGAGRRSLVAASGIGDSAQISTAPPEKADPAPVPGSLGI